MIGTSFVPVSVHLGQRGALGIGFVGERAVFVREIFLAAVQFEFAVGAERRPFSPGSTVISIMPV